MITKQNIKMFKYLLVMTALVSVGFQGWRSILNNHAVEIIGINGKEMGIIQSVREIPGLLALLVVYLLLVIKEHRLAAVSLLVFGIGIAMTGFLNTFEGLAISTVVMSFGFHYYETVNQSLTLQYFSKKSTPQILATIKRMGALCHVLVGVFVLLVSSFMTYTQMFLALGVFVLIGAIWCLTQNPANHNIPVQHKKMVLRKRYWLFYTLTMLAGARRQIFVAFAVFLLVKKFEFSIQEIAFLFILNNIVNYILLPYIGKAVSKFGERKTLSFEYLSLIFVFMFYIYTDSKILIACIYVIDNVLINFRMAVQSYFQKVATPSDIAASVAVGFTINHVIAVFLPFVGGVLWLIDYRIPFVLGAVLSLVSLLFVQLIKVPEEA
ncbi:MAG: MFS transporter [Alphaproteobacteria bacterium]